MEIKSRCRKMVIIYLVGEILILLRIKNIEICLIINEKNGKKRTPFWFNFTFLKHIITRINIWSFIETRFLFIRNRFHIFDLQKPEDIIDCNLAIHAPQNICS